METRCPEGSSNLLKVTQPASSGVGICTQFIFASPSPPGSLAQSMGSKGLGWRRLLPHRPPEASELSCGGGQDGLGGGGVSPEGTSTSSPLVGLLPCCRAQQLSPCGHVGSGPVQLACCHPSRRGGRQGTGVGGVARTSTTPPSHALSPAPSGAAPGAPRKKESFGLSPQRGWQLGARWAGLPADPLSDLGSLARHTDLCGLQGGVRTAALLCPGGLE